MWNIVNIMGAYALTVRRFIGEHQNSAAASTILTLSTNLNANENFDSKEMATESIIYQANAVSSNERIKLTSRIFYIHFTNLQKKR